MASKSTSIGSTRFGIVADPRPFNRALHAAHLRIQDWEKRRQGLAFFFLFPLGRRAYVEVPRGK